ncbi:hypothetical protein AB1Y20_018298 [Prymnesium parvum]|uniref:BED-type domain-containing protein n=1 Tax=Prymnesium parvum TaxID=97485 RepID=A0AB34JNU0_PRYPA
MLLLMLQLMHLDLRLRQRQRLLRPQHLLSSWFCMRQSSSTKMGALQRASARQCRHEKDKNGAASTLSILARARDTDAINVQCRHCGKHYCATSGRVKDHLLAMNGSAACSGNSAEFIALKETLMSKLSVKQAQHEMKKATKFINHMWTLMMRPTVVSSASLVVMDWAGEADMACGKR